MHSNGDMQTAYMHGTYHGVSINTINVIDSSELCNTAQPDQTQDICTHCLTCWGPAKTTRQPCLYLPPCDMCHESCGMVEWHEGTKQV